MYDRILVPTDGSTGSAHVALQALNLAEQYDATLYPLYVVDSSILSVLDTESVEDETLHSEGKRAVDIVDRMAESHGVQSESAIREGNPSETILAYADEIEADIIVAGTHGRTGVSRTILGSVAERLVRHASCPVLTVRLPDTDVTIDTVDEARDRLESKLAGEGLEDAEFTDIERQLHVWVGQAETDEEHLTMYLDPITQRISLLQQTADGDLE